MRLIFRPILSLIALATLIGSPATAQTSSPSPPDVVALPYQEQLGAVHCRADFPLNELEDVRENLTLLQNDLIKYLGIPIPDEPIELYLFSTNELYAKTLKQIYPFAPTDRPALYIKDGGPGMLFVQRDNQMLLNIRHEMTHAILNASLRNVPIWIDEGLAKYFETPQGKRGYENPFLKEVTLSANRFFSWGRVPALERLEKLQYINQMGEREYRESWAWIHFLIHRSPETQQLLAGYLATLRPVHQLGISQSEAIKIQKTTPLTNLLKDRLPEYKQEFVAHYKIWDVGSLPDR